MKTKRRRLIREIVGGEPYEYYSLGEHVVSAPGVCGGRPTFKYTRIEVGIFLESLACGYSLNKLLMGYGGRVTQEAVEEAASLAHQALLKHVPRRTPAARST